MQGTLSEIDIRSILQLIELGQRTGQLLVETNCFSASPEDRFSVGTPQPELSKWFVFFNNGQIAYATQGSHGSLDRLQDYLRRYSGVEALSPLNNSRMATNAPGEYSDLWLLLEKRILTPAQGRTILQNMVEETLFDLLSLHSGYFMFEMSPTLSPQLMTWEISPLISKIVKQVQQWKQFHPYIQSPNACPTLTDEVQLRAMLAENTYNSLRRWADGKTSLRQLCRYLNRPLFSIAKAIYPYVQRGWVQLIEEQPSSTAGRSDSEVPRVLCIDDDQTLCKTVEKMLQEQGYEIASTTDAIASLSLCFQTRPHLILCDIAMPDLNGYEICGMLRRSTLFRQTPIVMLTGKDGFIDRVQARMVGSTDYLTKPFHRNELFMLVEKYISRRPLLSSVEELTAKAS